MYYYDRTYLASLKPEIFLKGDKQEYIYSTDKNLELGDIPWLKVNYIISTL